MTDLSQRINSVQTPIIPEVADLIKANPGTVSLGQGVVFYKPPSSIAEGVAHFSSLESHHYEAVEGIEQLREMIGKKIQNENRIDPSVYETVVCAGSNMGFLNAILAICDPGDEIILLKPWYFNHEMAITMANCTAVSVDTYSNFQPNIDSIEQAITDRTKAVVTISPNNPTGAVYPKDTLIQINELCGHHDIFHIHDEAYEYFCYDDAVHYSPASSNKAENHTISLFSTSKSFGMANWRIGYMVIPPRLFKAIRKIQDTNLICPPVISQFAALECLKRGQAFCLPHIEQIKSVRSHLIDALEPLHQFKRSQLQGAFYAFIKMPASKMTDFETVKYLIENHQVAVIPGSAFGVGDSRHLRVSYGALDPAIAMDGIDRLVEGFFSLLQR